MRLIDRLVLRELIGPFLFGVAAFTSIFFAGNNLLKIISDMVKGLPVSAAVELLLLQLPGIVALVLPMAVLLGVLLALSRLSGESEVIALYAGGVSLYRVVVTVFALGLGMSVVTFVLNDSIAPAANVKVAEIRSELLKEQVALEKPVPLADIKDGITNSIIYVQGGVEPKSRQLRDVNVILFRNDRPFVFIHAKSAQYKGGFKWRLKDGYTESLLPVNRTGPTDVVQTGRFDEMKTDVTLRHTPEEIRALRQKPEQLTFRELLGQIRRLNLKGAPTVTEELDLYNKIALPLSAFVFAVLASSLGIRSHRGGSSVGLGLSVLIIFIYWIVWHFMTAIAKQGTINPFIGSFSASILTLVVGVGLLMKAAR